MNTVKKSTTEPILLNKNSEISQKVCGIVMPIAEMGDYTESHWSDVQNIIKESVISAGYESRLVSESADATVIIRSIVQNVYNDEIVICDVSGMNPNVMFELGMRLAFDKPVIIIKDENTRFSFDISSIEHLIYPRSLRYQDIQNFKKRLADKLKATIELSTKDGYRSFLSNFGSFTVANLNETTLNESQALERILGKLDKFDHRLLSLESIPVSLTDRDTGLIRHLNEAYNKKYRSIIQMSLGKEFQPENLNTIDDSLKSIYGDEIAVTLTGNEDSVRLNVLANFDPSKATLMKIRRIIESAMNSEK